MLISLSYLKNFNLLSFFKPRLQISKCKIIGMLYLTLKQKQHYIDDQFKYLNFKNLFKIFYSKWPMNVFYAIYDSHKGLWSKSPSDL